MRIIRYVVLLLLLCNTAFAGVPPSLSDAIFVADYDDGVLNADKAAGSPTATFSASRSATTPATYFDINGIMQITTQSNEGRFNYGYYDTSGYTAFSTSGLMIEGATTNYILQTIFAADGNADGVANNWAIFKDVNGATTESIVNGKSTFNVGTIVGIEHLEYGGNAGDANDSYTLYSDNTAGGSFVQTDNVTISVWIKGETTAGNLKIGYREFDAGDVAGSTHLSASIISSLSATEWRRFTYSLATTDADCNKVAARVSFDADIDANETFDIYVACIQIEKLPFASSFVPTTTAALTRNKETLKYVINKNRNVAVESCVVKLAPEYIHDTTGSKYVISADTKDRRIKFHTATNDVRVVPNATDSAGSAVGDLINESWTVGQEMTLGYTCQATGNPNVAGFYNGIADGTNDNDDFTVNAWGTYWWLGSFNDGSAQLYGTIFSIAFWDRVIVAKEMKALHDYDWEPLVFPRMYLHGKMGLRTGYKQRYDFR